MAQQGHAFATAEEVRVVYSSQEGTGDGPLKDVPRDGKTVGEIVTRGNIVMKEVCFRVSVRDYLTQWLINYQYFRDAEATNKAFQGGSFHTGDLAVMHPNGSIAIMDRSKDIIISGGEVSSDTVSIFRHSFVSFPKNASSLSIEQG